MQMSFCATNGDDNVTTNTLTRCKTSRSRPRRATYDTYHALARDASLVYAAYLAGRPSAELPEFEEYVFQICEVAKELRKKFDYTYDNTLPCDSMLRTWRREVRQGMV